jgi:hypothetical protein
VIWTFHALSLKTGQEPGNCCIRVQQNFFEIDLSLHPKFTQPDAYAGALPAAFKAIGYPLCKRHNRSFSRDVFIIPLSLSEAKLFRMMVDACCGCTLRICNIAGGHR